MTGESNQLKTWRFGSLYVIVTTLNLVSHSLQPFEALLQFARFRFVLEDDTVLAYCSKDVDLLVQFYRLGRNHELQDEDLPRL